MDGKCQMGVVLRKVFVRRSTRPEAPVTQLPDRFPLVELHCHIEGTVTPEEARALAARHGVDLSGIFDETGNYAWTNFSEFLTAYDAMTEAVRTPEDYYEITLDYYRRAAADGVLYGEMFISNDHPARFGVSYPDLLEGITSALRDVEAETGIVGRLILTGVRHYGVEAVEASARLAEAHPHPMVTGFGMAGDESFGHPSDYAHAFDIARGAGLGLTVHAGEVEGPESVSAALDSLKPTRIGHGVTAIEDRDLAARLACEDIVLEVCPTSNLALGLFASAEEHPLTALFEAGVLVTLSSDDPAFFGASVRQEYEQAIAAHGFNLAQLAEMTRTAIDAAFLKGPEKEALRSRVETLLSGKALPEQNKQS